MSVEVGYLQHYLVVTWLMPHKTDAVSVHVLCTLYIHAPVYSIILFEATYVCCIRRVQVCLAVTCHLHFWQNSWYLLHATAVTRGVKHV